jgi:colanic acid biosynthesis glycosyl transferase WcaI
MRGADSMNVLILTPDFPPMLNSAARLFSELAESLTDSGHNVTVLTRTGPVGIEMTAKRKHLGLTYESQQGRISVLRPKNLPLPKDIILLRAIGEIWTALVFFLVGLLLPRQEAVIVYSPPLFLGLTGWLLSRRWHAVFVLNIQDLYPRTAIDLGKITNRFLIRFSEFVERKLYTKADALTVHSEGNKEHVINVGASPEKVHVVPNWVDLNRYRKGTNRNSWRRTNDIDDRFMVSFAGTMGFAQGLDSVLEAADLLKNEDDIVFVLCGEGVLKRTVENRVSESGLANVKILPPQDAEDYLALLQTSDVCLVVLHRDLKTPVVPGKLQCIMAVGKPVICLANPASDVPKIIQEAECGIFITNGEPDIFAEAVLSLRNNSETRRCMGQRGRRYAEEKFDRTRNIRAYDEILTSHRPDSNP